VHAQSFGGSLGVAVGRVPGLRRLASHLIQTELCFKRWWATRNIKKAGGRKGKFQKLVGKRKISKAGGRHETFRKLVGTKEHVKNSWMKQICVHKEANVS
jgi:hypothetical protein